MPSPIDDAEPKSGFTAEKVKAAAELHLYWHAGRNGQDAIEYARRMENSGRPSLLKRAIRVEVERLVVQRSRQLIESDSRFFQS